MRPLILLLLTGCAHAVAPHHGGGFASARGVLQKQGVALAPVVFVADLPAPPLTPAGQPSAVQVQLEVGDPGPPPTILDTALPRDAAFLRNDWVGNIRYAGGFIYIDGRGVDVRTRLIDLGYDEVYRQQAEQWVKAVVEDTLAARHLSAVHTTATPLPGPQRGPSASPKRLLGEDNINNPVTTLRPQPLSVEQRQAAVAVAGGRRVLLVPAVRAYYTHNGGWFIGQTWGCHGGERIELLLTAYDLETGEPIWWHTASHARFEVTSSPSTAELEAGLQITRDKVAKVVKKTLLK